MQTNNKKQAIKTCQRSLRERVMMTSYVHGIGKAEGYTSVSIIYVI
jgi:hypothetical protein